MLISKKDAIRAINYATESVDWCEMMEDLELYDEGSDDWPTLYDVFEAIGISIEEAREL